MECVQCGGQTVKRWGPSLHSPPSRGSWGWNSKMAIEDERIEIPEQPQRETTHHVGLQGEKGTN